MLRASFALVILLLIQLNSYSIPFPNAVAARQSEKADVSCEWETISVSVFLR